MDNKALEQAFLQGLEQGYEQAKAEMNGTPEQMANDEMQGQEVPMQAPQETMQEDNQQMLDYKRALELLKARKESQQ